MDHDGGTRDARSAMHVARELVVVTSESAGELADELAGELASELAGGGARRQE